MIIKSVIYLSIVTGFLITSHTNTYGQDSLSYKNLSIADSLYKENLFDEAREYYKSSIFDFEQNEKWDKWESCYRGLQRIAFKTKNFNFSMDSLEGYYNILPVEEIGLRARCRLYRAYNLDRLGYLLPALNVFKESLSNYNEMKDSSDIKSSEGHINYLYKSIGNGYSKLGDQLTAIKYARKGYEVAGKSGNRAAICDFLSLIGKYSYHNNQTNLAIQKYKSMLTECGPSISTYYFITEAYLSLDSLEEAKNYLDKAEELITEDVSNWANQYQQNYSSLYYFKKGLYQKSFNTKEKELSILENKYDTREYLKQLVVYAQNLEERGLYSRSIIQAHKAISIYFPTVDSTNIWSRPNMDGSLPDIHILEAFNLKAKHFSTLFHNSSDEKALNEATYYYQLFFEYFDHLKDTYYSVNSQYRIGAHTQEIYGEAIHFYLKLYADQNQKEAFEIALELAQKANAFTLKNSIGERKRLEIAKVTSEEINEYLYLKSEVQTNDQDSINQLSKLIQFNDYQKSLFTKYPTLRKFKETHLLSLAEIQEYLDKNALLVKYFFSSKGLVQFAISKENYQIEEIDLPVEFDSLLNIYQELSSSPSSWNMKTYAQVSKSLYDIVIANVLNKEISLNKSHLIIAPDGHIKNIAFSSLITDQIHEVIDTKDYLIHDYEISYIYYCSQLKESKNNKKTNEGFISFGIEYQDDFLIDLIKDYQSQNTDQVKRDFALAKLKYAKKEALSSAEILNGESLTNAEATLNNVLTVIDDYKHLHFSTHAFVDNNDYLKSFIALNKNPEEDYQFKYKDIINLNLNADLVVLSACQTNSGTDILGEGLMSLSRAFIQSGCKSSMGAYWNAPDLSTMQLMELFYLNLKNGMSKSAALRRAQIEYLQNEEYATPRTRSPFYWSSWAIYGDNSSMAKPFGLNRLYKHPKIMFITGIFLLLVLFFGLMDI